MQQCDTALISSFWKNILSDLMTYRYHPNQYFRYRYQQKILSRWINFFWLLKTFKGHFTKVYSIKVCEPQNFSKFPWDSVIGLDSIQTVCLQLNPIGGSQGNFEKFWEILRFTDLNRVNFREMAFNLNVLPRRAWLLLILLAKFYV